MVRSDPMEAVCIPPINLSPEYLPASKHSRKTAPYHPPRPLVGTPESVVVVRRIIRQRQTIQLYDPRNPCIRIGRGCPSGTCTLHGTRISLLPKLEGNTTASSVGYPVIPLRQSQVDLGPPGGARTLTIEKLKINYNFFFF